MVASIDCPPLDPKQPSKPFELELLDNGIGADAKRDDGVYSRYFATFTQLGRYSFRFHFLNVLDVVSLVHCAALLFSFRIPV